MGAAPSVAKEMSLEEFMDQQAAAAKRLRQRGGCYARVEGVAYDVSNFISQHRGGSQVLANSCCSDVTSSFKIQHQGFANGAAREMLKSLPTVGADQFARSCPVAR